MRWPRLSRHRPPRKLAGSRRLATHSERWQSGRMYLTRNQAYVKAYRGFESLPLRQKQATPRLGRFLFLKGTLGKNPLGYSTHPCVSPCGPAAAPLFASASCRRSRRIRPERMRTAAGWPRSAQREGVRPMDGPNNASLSASSTKASRQWDVFSFPAGFHLTIKVAAKVGHLARVVDLLAFVNRQAAAAATRGPR